MSKSLLKFITCGSVDDGKSTLIGHMLYDAKLIYTDQQNSLKLQSKVGIDYSLLLDGLSAEREQGITIDVAYRYFSTNKRNFIVADTPGHEEYTRNMSVGASFADIAIILIDAINVSKKGILTQTKRHIRICSMMGIKHFIITINKMDLIEYDEKIFNEITILIKDFIKEFNYESLNIIPVSAKQGDNLTKLSNNMDWYKGKTLLNLLENIDISIKNQYNSFIMPVQRVSRPNLNFRGFQGQVVQGMLSVGDKITILPSNEQANVKQLLITNHESNKISIGQAVTITLDKEVDCSRGCVIVKDYNRIPTRLFRSEILWTDDDELIVGRNYLLKIGTKLVPATVIKIHYKIDINTGQHISQVKGCKNDIIDCDISLSEKAIVDSFDNCQELGRFILINRLNNMTSACGIVKHTLSRSDNLTWQNMDINREIRAEQKHQKPITLWFTGLSGSGKSTIANALEKALFSQNKHTMLLDGDNVRIGLNNNLGFSESDRVENIRRIAETSKLMNDAGLITIVSVISPFARDRQNAKTIIGENIFFEIYVSTSLEECERRDVKGLYQKARNGEIPNFTGISSPYDIPTNANFIADTEKYSVNEIVDQILEIIL